MIDKTPQPGFSSCDPAAADHSHLAQPQRWNLYAFVINNPVSLYDPDGRKDEGRGGGKVIDVFITLGNKDPERPNQVKMNWRGLENNARSTTKKGVRDVTVNSIASTRTKSPTRGSRGRSRPPAELQSSSGIPCPPGSSKW